MMKKTLIGFGAVLSLAAPMSAAHALTVVAPNSAMSTDGNSASGLPLSSNAATIQFIYPTSALGGLTNGDQITGIAFRLNNSESSPNPALTFSNYVIQLSQSINAPGFLSTTFAANIASDGVTVRNGSLTFVANSFSSGASPNAFGSVINFTTPYTYTGGSLLITLSHTGNGSGVSPLIDADGTFGGQSLTATGSFNATTGNPNVATPIAQFTVQPVPFTFSPLPGLLLTGVGKLAFRVRNQRRKDAQPQSAN